MLSGKLNPFDVEPDPHGLWCVAGDGETPAMDHWQLGEAKKARYTSHFATCFVAARFRNRSPIDTSPVA